MSSSLIPTFTSHLRELEILIKDQGANCTPEACFSQHVYDLAKETAPHSTLPTLPPVARIQEGFGPCVAATGFLLSKIDTPPSDIADAWRVGLERLSKKEACPPDRQTFAYRPLEVYGICRGLGKHAQGNEAVIAWMTKVLATLDADAGSDFFSTAIYQAASAQLGYDWKHSVGTESDDAVECLALQRWLLVTGQSSETDTRVLDEQLLTLALRAPVAGLTVAAAALVHHALRRAVTERLQSDLKTSWHLTKETQSAAKIIVNVCRRFSHFAKQLQKRHNNRETIKFNDEYDIQDAFHAILWLFFDNIKEEEQTPSYAGNASRIDFVLKREKVVIEVKMTRSNLPQKTLTTQLIDDKTRYRQHPDCKTLVCFVYDPSNLIVNPTGFEDDLSESTDDFTALVVVNPK